MTKAEALERFLGYLRDGVIVGHHIGHDVSMLDAGLERMGTDVRLLNRSARHRRPDAAPGAGRRVHRREAARSPQPRHAGGSVRRHSARSPHGERRCVHHRAGVPAAAEAGDPPWPHQPRRRSARSSWFPSRLAAAHAEPMLGTWLRAFRPAVCLAGAWRVAGGVRSAGTRAARRPRAAERPPAHDGRRASRSAGAGRARRPHRVRGLRRRCGALHRPGHHVDRPRRASSAIPGFIEGHGHFAGLGESRLGLDLTGRDELAGDRPGGGRGGRACPAGAVDRRPRLASGQVDGAAAAERRRVPDARVARCGVAGQPGRPDPRQRSRRLRQCARAGALGHHTRDPQSAGRRDPQETRRASRPDS